MTPFEIRIELPCTPVHARVARTAAAACGALEGFSVDELSDMRLLVDEVFTTMYRLGARRLELDLAPLAGEVGVLIRADGPLGPGREDVDVQVAELLADVLARNVRFDLRGVPPFFAATLCRS